MSRFIRTQIILLACCAGVLNAQLYFKSGYEPGTTQDASLAGYSGTDNSTGFNWNAFAAGQVRGVCGVQNMYWNCANPGVDASAKIIDDPEGKHGKILRAQVVNHNPSGTVCRFELDQTFCAPDTATRAVRYDYKLDSSMNALKTAGVWDWFLISEIWSNGAVDNRASIPMYINKNGSSFSWELDLRYVTPGNDYTYPWTVTNTTVPVRVGTWMSVIMLFKPGLAGTGRFFFSVDGQTVFDVKDKDMLWNNQTWAYWCGQKLYVGPGIMDYMRNRGTPVTCYYDNYEVWAGMPTTATHSARPMRSSARDRASETRLHLSGTSFNKVNSAATFDLRGTRLDRMVAGSSGVGHMDRTAGSHCVVVVQSN